jgi:hypothetical protein
MPTKIDLFVEDGNVIQCDGIEDGVINFTIADTLDRISFTVSQFTRMIELGINKLNDELNRADNE